MTDYEVDKFHWQRAIFELTLPAVTKLTAIALSVYANKDGSKCHPGLERLAKDVGISPRRVADHVRRLREIGVVQLVAQGGGRGRRLADEYRLSWSDETANLVDALAKRRTKRPEYPRDTPDTTSVESAETTDVETNTPDVGANTPDVESNTTDAATSPHQATNTSHLSPGVLSPFSDSIAAPTSPSPDDNNNLEADVEYDAARGVLGRLGPDRLQQLLDEVHGDVGNDVPGRDLVVLAAQRVAS